MNANLTSIRKSSNDLSNSSSSNSIVLIMFIACSHSAVQAFTNAITIIPHSISQCQIGTEVEVGGAVASHLGTGAAAAIVMISSSREDLRAVDGQGTPQSLMYGLNQLILS